MQSSSGDFTYKAICDSNWRLVVDEDDDGKFRLERVKDLCLRKIILPSLLYIMLQMNFSFHFRHFYENNFIICNVYNLNKTT